jgi:hypothetical protein
LITTETVVTETPASLATSFIVYLDRCAMSFGERFPLMNRSLPEAWEGCAKTKGNIGFNAGSSIGERGRCSLDNKKRNVSLDSCFLASVHVNANFKVSHRMLQRFPVEAIAL